MAGFRRILAAVDFSPPTADVLAAAGAFAQAWQARLDVLHVLPLRDCDEAGPRTQLETIVPPALAGLVDARRMTRALAPDLGILEAAQQSGADLIAVGTHGRTGLPHIRLGSVAARVVENAPVPVLAVRAAGTSRGGSMVQFKRILCPVDFSEHSSAALAQAAEVARKFGAELTLLHVVEPILYPVAYGLPPVSPVDYESVARESASAALERLAAGLAGLKPSTRVDAGAASQRISEVAREEGFDLIVLATHGYTGLKHVLLGSTAERVVRFAPCAVLVVKAARAK